MTDDFNPESIKPLLTEEEQIRRFWQNPKVEKVLMVHDIATCQAHVRMLGDTGIVDAERVKTVLDGLDKVKEEIVSGADVLAATDIDIHAGIERRLRELVGESALVLRIAKSRNDQIATDIRLWLRDSVLSIFAELHALRLTLLDLSEKHLEVVMPGYTHLQPAMPILLGHWWLANENRFKRDFDRLSDFYKRLNQLPLGACSIAGSNLPIDRELVAQYLGFDSVINNSLDAISDRDYLIEFASCASLIGMHLSQLSADLLLWHTQEFGFVRLRKAFVFRSLSMPQKRNPELLEIMRARPSAIYGRLTEFLVVMKALPMGYSQDLQESLPGLLDMVDNLKFLLELARVLLPALEIDAKKMREAAYADLTNAANAVDFLVHQNVAVDQATKIVDSLVSYCKQRNKYLSDLEMNEWQHFSPAFNEEIYKYLNIEESVSLQSSFGGTSEDQVSPAINRAKEILQEDYMRMPGRSQKKAQKPARVNEGSEVGSQS